MVKIAIVNIPVNIKLSSIFNEKLWKIEEIVRNIFLGIYTGIYV
jgi:hypothetical protein